MNIPASVFRWLGIVWTVVMLIGCLAPHEEIPNELATFNDKFLHVVIFVPFTFLWILGGVRIRQALLIGILFGGLIEVLQGILPINRNADWLDLAADSLGAVIGVLGGWLLTKNYKITNS